MSADIYKKYFFVLAPAFLIPLFTHAQVSKIVFTTEPQTIKPDELSGPLTIQTQDSSGSSYKTPETIDLEFVSTSSTGEFLGSTGNPVTKTMSTNTSNRTFYYKDSGLGTFTLTVNAKGRTSGTTWNAGQVITVSESASASTTEATSTPTTPTSSGTINTSVVIISTHYSAAPLTNTETDTKFEVGAGRLRMSTVGTPIEFNANTNASYSKNIDFGWSFGDGTTGAGQILTHTYAYPGEYTVVLNAASSDGVAVSRTNVSIVPANLSITTAGSSHIEVVNNSSREVNLYGRALVAGSKIFAFPRDTIIKAGQKISFGANVTGLNPLGQSSVSLMVVGTEVRPQVVIAKVEEERRKEIEHLSTELGVLRNKLARLKAEEHLSNLAQEQGANSEAIADEVQDTIEGDESQTALVLQSANAVKPAKLDGWLNALKRFFFGTRE